MTLAATFPELTERLFERVRQVRADLGLPPMRLNGNTSFADVLDSMGLVEFLMLLAEDLGATTGEIEGCVGRRFGTIAELAEAIRAAGLVERGSNAAPRLDTPRLPAAAEPRQTPCWLGGATAGLPRTIQPAAALNALLQRPSGWLENHAGIQQRRIWGGEEPFEVVATAVHSCLDRTGLLIEQVGALLVTSEVPPLLTGLAAALHHKLDLRPATIALEIGGACAGFLSALWTGRAILHQVGVVLIVALEAPSRWLRVEPGAAGEAAALFGDGAAACVLCEHPPSAESVEVGEVVLGVDGSAASLVQVESTGPGVAEVRFDGEALALRAVRTMAEGVTDLARLHGLTVGELEAVVAHGGNGRLPGLLARQLDLAPERIWSLTPETGNLGSASLPAAWASRQPPPSGPVVWVAVGAGLTWGVALTGQS